MSRMFNNSGFNQPLNDWDVTSVIFMDSMFENSDFNQPLDEWETISLQDTRDMFANTPFDQDLSAWDIGDVFDMDNMFLGTTLSTANLDATLVAWAAQTLQSGVDFHLGLKTYSLTGANAVQTLRQTYSWDVSEEYLLSYSVQPNASLVGSSTQRVSESTSGSSITIVPDAGFQFQRWSDNRTDNPRIDSGASDNVSVSAIISENNTVRSSSAGTSISRRIQYLEETGMTEQAKTLSDKHDGLSANSPTSTTTAELTSLIVALEELAAVNPEAKLSELDESTTAKIRLILLQVIVLIMSILQGRV